MSVDAAIVEQLLATSGVTDLVSTRIYKDVAPTSGIIPRVTVQLIGEPVKRDMGGSVSLTQALVQVDVRAALPSAREDIAAAVRAALNDYTPGTMGGATIQVTVRSLALLDVANDAEPPLDQSEDWVFRQRMDFSVWHN